MRIKPLHILGAICLILSSFCLYHSISIVSDPAEGSELRYVLWLVTARMFGLGAFAIAVISLAKKEWTSSAIFFLGSLGLPFLSFLVQGRI